MDARIEALLSAYHAGRLGGENMPEDENPGLSPGCSENYMYFTLPMALNYQRNSYVLWQCANKMYQDHPEVFNANSVCRMQESKLKEILVKHKVALQPNKQPIIWKTKVQQITAERWETLLAGSGLMPIDIYTPLWLWSHGKFSVEI